MLYLWLKLIHIVSSTLLFGTGLGSAFYMYRAQRSNDLQAMYFAAKNVALADWLFTTPAVIIQPLSGFSLIYLAGFPLTSFWIVASLCLYIVAGACWIPVVYIQIKMRNLLAECIDHNKSVPTQYYRLFTLWFRLGWPAFISVIIIFYFMVLKPTYE